MCSHFDSFVIPNIELLSDHYAKQLSFFIIRYFLPNHGSILPALMEKSKIKKLPLLGMNPQPPDHQPLLTVLARNLLLACVNHSAFIKSSSIDF